ncbi:MULTISPECIES: group II intron reverse transcriptase/maturase [Bacteroides]|jgi:group II intron reverse transcriptase/maturase|uniref:group II intron reverse transcriptase/maturase n=1 Tax=Bacteroides sp. TaxID=29523 RepID=UPI002276AC37|nr:group II intron reverse transcriptase/maturase [Bacteroides fragilis]
MRSPEVVLNNLAEHSKKPDYKYQRLYRILFNEEMFYIAYQRISANKGGMTAGSDNQTLDEMSLSRIHELITTLQDESYQPKPARRVYIPKKNGKKRPLGMPSANDKLVQEVLRMILEAIYEGQFSYCSHGFRPNRSCHTALAQIQKSFRGVKWFVEGDIKGYFDNINHTILINTLCERIDDERFIRLVRKFLNAGYIEDWKFQRTYSGTPQGGIISPILANIYLDKLDKYIADYIDNFDKGKKRERSEESRILINERHKLRNKLKKETNENMRIELVKKYKTLQIQSALVPPADEMDENYKRLKYVRYADDFLIGVIGSKADAQKIKEDITKYLSEVLALELSEEKTLITNSSKAAKFLGYEIDVMTSNTTKRDINGVMRRVFNKNLRLMIGKDTIKHKLLSEDMIEIKTHNGIEQWKPKSKSELVVNDDLEILDRYNSMIRGFVNYYSLASNRRELHSFKYIMEYSMYKTFAHKYRSKVPKILTKYKKNGIFTVQFTVKSGKVKERTFYDDGCKSKGPSKFSDIDNIHNVMFTVSITSLADRLKANKCELCGAEDIELEMHHINKLKNITGKSQWEKLMMARRRKTIAVCKKCHNTIHHNEK